MPSILNTTTLGGYPVYDPRDAGDTRPCPPVNWFETGTGASRKHAGYGVFLMRRQDYGNIKVATPPTGYPDVVAKLEMKGTPGPGLTISVYLVCAIPFSLAVAGIPTGSASDATTSNDDMMLVYVRDTRARSNVLASTDGGGISKGRAYNVQAPTFGYSAEDTPVFLYDTLNSGAEWTWAQMLSDMSIPALPANPSWKPRNMYFGGEYGEAVDQVGEALQLVVGWTIGHNVAADVYYINAFTFNNPDSISSSNSTLFDGASRYRLSGGPSDRARRLPRYIQVLFPGLWPGYLDKYGPTYRTVHYAGAGYALPAPDNTGSLVAEPYYWGYHVQSNTPWAYEATLFSTLRDDIGQRRYNWIKAVPGSYEFAGIWNFICDGRIRRIRWQSDANGARTLIKTNDESPFQAGSPGVSDCWGHRPPIGNSSYPLSRGGMTAADPLLFRDDGTGNTQVHNVQWPIVEAVTTGTGTGNGIYTGTCRMPENRTYNGSALGFLGGGSGGGESTACVIYNEAELHVQSKSLPVSGAYGLLGQLIGWTTDTPPKPIVRVNGGPSRTTSGDILSTGTKHWTYGSLNSGDAYGTNGISFDIVVRQEAGGSTGEVKYYKRTLSFDVQGKLITVSAEDAGTTITVPP